MGGEVDPHRAPEQNRGVQEANIGENPAGALNSGFRHLISLGAKTSQKPASIRHHIILSNAPNPDVM